MKPTSIRHHLALAAAGVLALTAGLSALADYPSSVLADGPLTYYRFSEAAVVPTPYPLATNIGTLGAVANGADAVAQDPGVVRGVSGALADPDNTAYNFPGGTNTAVVIPYNAVLAQAAPFSVEFWAKPKFPGSSMSAWGTPTAFFDYNSPRHGWLLYQSDSSQNYGNGWMFRLYANNGTAMVADAQITAPVDANVWYHVVAVWDGATAKIYTNGVLAVSANKNSNTYSPPTTARALTIGSRGNTGSTATYEYNGAIDEYAYYTNALSAADIAAHHDAATTNAAGYADQVLALNPAGYWRFNEKFNPTVVPNAGTGGLAFDGTYRQGAATAAETVGGIDSGNRVLALATSNPGYVNIPPLWRNSVNAATIECWIKRNGEQSTAAGVVYYRHPAVSGTAANSGGLCFATGTTLGYNWNNGSIWNSGLTPPDGQWAYVALAISSSRAVMYMYDGTTWSAATNTVAIGAMPIYWNMNIGYDSGSASRYFNGSIDEVAVYAKTLSGNQLRGHALAGYGDSNPPTFLIDPPELTTKGTIYAGWPFSLSVDAYGVPPLTFQWRQDGTNIVNATNTTYSVTSAAASDSGNYDVVVTNPNGSTTNTTTTAVAVVTTPPDVVTGLRTWLRFDETGGLTATDSSGNGRDGTLLNFYSDPAQWVPGLITNALSVNPDYWGEQQVVVVTNLEAFDFSSNLEFSLSAWVYVNPALQGNNNGGIIARGYGGGGEQYCLDIDAGKFRFFVRNASGTAIIASTTVAANGAWQHVCGVYKAADGLMKIYVNGVQAGTATPPSSLFTASHELSIGSRQSANYDGAPYDFNLVGLIDDARIYGRALVAAEVQALYTAAPTVAPSVVQDPVGRSVFSGGSVTLSAVAAGTLPLKYQWFRNSTAVSGATASTLTLASVTAANIGTYSLRVTNGGGFTNTAPAVVGLLPAPENTYESLVVADDPEAYWRLNEAYDGTGIILDSMGRHDGATRAWGGTVDGGAGFTYSQPGALVENPDTSILFQNYNQNLVTVPFSTGLNSVPFSFECWANLSSLPVSPNFYATYSSVSSTAGAVNRGSGLFAMGQYGDWENWFYLNGLWGVSYGSPTAASQWVHLVSTYDGEWQRLYANGELVASLPMSFYPNTTTPFHIGSSRSDWGSGDKWFDGLLDEVAWYKAALTPARVNAHYTLGLYGTNSLPVFVQPPASQTVTAGDTATFTAAAIGAPTISYQWKKDGADIAGATDLTLNVPNVYYTDGGSQYQLAVTNGVGGVVSLPATLTVLPPASQTNLVIRTSTGGPDAVLELIWPAGTLWSAPAVTGPWTAVEGATLPYYTVSPTNAATFFRCE